MLLLLLLLPCLHSHLAALVRVCLLLFASSCSPTPFSCFHSPTPVHLLLFAHSHLPALVHVHLPSLLCLPTLIRICPFAFVFAHSCLSVHVHVHPLLFVIAAVPAAAVVRLLPCAAGTCLRCPHACYLHTYIVSTY